MYGIGYTHSNGSFIQGNGSGWGMYVASDGDARIFLGATSDSVSYINTTGNFGLGTSSPSERLHVYGKIKQTGTGNNNNVFYRAYSSDGTGLFGFAWDGGTNNYNCWIRMKAINGTEQNVGRFENDSYSTSIINFTGQHRCITKPNVNSSMSGLIVYSTGEYFNINNTNSPQICESLPIVDLCTTDDDIRVFGVISDEIDDNEDSFFGYGILKTLQRKTNKNETRIHINSLGEGAMWICNKNGNIQNGNYISSSSVSGYGIKQNSNHLLNSTVAKITCDCDFNLTKLVKQKIKIRTITTSIEKQKVEIVNKTKVSTEIVFDANINGYVEKEVSTTDTIHEDVFEIVPLYDQQGNQLKDDEDVLRTYKKKVMENVQVTKTELVYDSNGNIQYEDDLDENNQQQIVYKYDTRFLNADGSLITTEEEYTTKKNAGENVYIACFVGCTYHCG